MMDAKSIAAASPFQNKEFKDFLRRLVAVPKAETDAEEKKYQRRKARRAKRK